MTLRFDKIAPNVIPMRESAKDSLHRVLKSCNAMPFFLAEAVRAAEPVLLLVNDPHRSTQTRPALEAVARLIDCTFTDTNSVVSAEDHRDRPRFDVLVATGTHRFSEKEQRAFEQAVLTGCGLDIRTVVWHDADENESLRPIAGVELHRMIADARFLIPIGSVEPHYFAGVTGPHKTVTIGCMSHGDIERNHAHALSSASDILRLEGNPVHDDIAKTLHELKQGGKTICAIGQIVCGNELLDVAVGDPLDVVNALLPAVKNTYTRTIERQADVLHLRVPPPLGNNLYQADKALKNNQLAVRDGGGIVLEASCTEGIGPEAFLNLLRRSSDYAHAQQIVAQDGYCLSDHKAVKLRYLTDPACRGVHVVIVSPNLSSASLKDTGLSVFDTVDGALDALRSRIGGPLDDGLIVEDAAMMCVVPEAS